MNKLFIIFKHEFKQITKGKVFIIMTLLGPIFFGLITILPAYFATKSSEPENGASIAIFTNDQEIYEIIKNGLLLQELDTIQVDDIKEGQNLVITEAVKGLIIIPSDIINARSMKYFSSTGTDFQYSNVIKKIIKNYIDTQKKSKLGISKKDSDWLSRDIDIISLKLLDNGNVDNSSYESVLIVSTVLSILIMMTVLIYGLTAARSVLAEKSSKTVEILLSSVKPFKILLGKVLGAGIAGLIQFCVWILMTIIAIKFILPTLNIEIPQTILFTPNIIILFIFFILGFFFYIFIYAAIGANVENEQNLGHVQIPLQLVLMMPIMISTAIISNPNGVLSRVLSYLPFTSPTVMSIRLLVDSPGWLMVSISMIILLLSLISVLFASSKLFKIGLLTKGKKINFIQFVKLLFMK